MIRVNCWKCGRNVKVRVDGNMPKHKPLEYHALTQAELNAGDWAIWPRYPDNCPASETAA